MAKDKNSEAAKKVADAEKASKKTAKNDGKPNVFVRAATAVAKFFKDLKGETKKIVWPGAKLVLKNTGIVLVVIFVCAIIIGALDYAFGTGIAALTKLFN